MVTVQVRVGGRHYPIRIGAGSLAEAGALIRERLNPGGVLVVTDRTVARLHAAALRRSLRRAGIRVLAWDAVRPGETSKSLGRVRQLYASWLAAGADRSTAVVAMGGGVVGDLAGFAASTYHRGLPLVHLPTTLIAQADSSIGGKTGVNWGGVKNLVGTYHQPELVVSDTALLATLPARDFRAGMAEVVKIAVTLRPDVLERMELDLEGIQAREPELLAALITAAAEAKAEVVGRDERDADVRNILNYGHTVGHAVEAAARGRLRHGEAVAVGMNAAAWVARSLGVATENVRTRQNALLEALGLKIAHAGADKDLILRNLKLDKKVRGRKNRFVLTLQMGGASVWPHISSRLLRSAVKVITS